MQIIRGLSFPMKFTQRGGLGTSQKAQKLFDNIKNIVTTTVNSRVMRPTYGIPSEDLLFSKMRTETPMELRSDIIEAITLYEPRVRLTKVDVTADESSYNVKVSFRVNGLGFQPENSFQQIFKF